MSTSDLPQPVSLNAPAKLNLTLRIHGRRDDGFHEIETLMTRLPGLHDTITCRASPAFEFTCDDPTLPTGDENLVVRAAHAFARATGTSPDVAIHLEKRIPSGAGLGGGSSDAAATLCAMQEIHGSPLDHAALANVAAGIGSDVPFFLHPGPALCTGRGEIPANPPARPPSLRVLVIKPGFPVATADAYGGLAASPPPVPGVSLQAQAIDGLEICNDMELPVFQKYRFLAELKSWLLHRPDVRAAMLAGSGASLFAVLTPAADPDAIAADARHELDGTLWHWHGTTE